MELTQTSVECAELLRNEAKRLIEIAQQETNECYRKCLPDLGAEGRVKAAHYCEAADLIEKHGRCNEIIRREIRQHNEESPQDISIQSGRDDSSEREDKRSSSPRTSITHRRRSEGTQRCEPPTHYAGGCTGHCQKAELESLPSTLEVIGEEVVHNERHPLDAMEERYRDYFPDVPIEDDEDIQVIDDNGGMKNDGAKLRWELLPVEPIEDLVRILTFGAKKYEPNNWKKVDPDRYIGALYRHLIAWQRGEKVDLDSGEHHLAHALCNVMFLLWMDKYRGQ